MSDTYIDLHTSENGEQRLFVNGELAVQINAVGEVVKGREYLYVSRVEAAADSRWNLIKRWLTNMARSQP